MSLITEKRATMSQKKPRAKLCSLKLLLFRPLKIGKSFVFGCVVVSCFHAISGTTTSRFKGAGGGGGGLLLPLSLRDSTPLPIQRAPLNYFEVSIFG